MSNWSNCIVKEDGVFSLAELYYNRVGDNVVVTGFSVEDGPFAELSDLLAFKGAGRDIDEAIRQGFYVEYKDSTYSAYSLTTGEKEYL